MIPKPQTLSEAILATIVYFDVADFALTTEEVHRYLYGWSKVSVAHIQSELAHISPLVESTRGLWTLRGRSKLIERREKSLKIERKLWKQVEKYSWIFHAIPHIKMAAVSNSLAFGNVTETSDIDFFVITKKDKVDEVRAGLKFLSQLYGIRVQGKRRAGRFCFSFIVDEDNEDMKEYSFNFDPHLAYITAFMRPIIGYEYYKTWHAYEQTWLKKYFIRTLTPQAFLPYDQSVSPPLLKMLLTKAIPYLIEPLERRRLIQYLKNTPPSSSIVHTSGVSKLHERDTRTQYAQSFSGRFLSVKSTHIAVP